MKQVTKDNGYITILVPRRDLESMARFISHAFVANQNFATDLMHNIVTGDILKQDEYVTQLVNTLDLDNWLLVLSGPEALELCDNLADTIYSDEKPKEEKHLRIAKICVNCQRGYIDTHECVK